MGKKSAHKGSSFERHICKQLSLWASNKADAAVFWRTSGSGARAEVLSQHGQFIGEIAGDVGAIKPIGRELIQSVFIECKHVGDLQLTNFLLDRPSAIQKHFMKAKHQAEKYAKVPVTIVKQNRLPILVCIDEWWSNFAPFTHSRLCRVQQSSLAQELHVFDFEKLLATVSYSYFIGVAQEIQRQYY